MIMKFSPTVYLDNYHVFLNFNPLMSKKVKDSNKIQQVVIVDDHEIFAIGLKHILEINLGIKAGLHFSCAQAALNYFKNGGGADLVILELYISEMNSFNFLEQVKILLPKINILVFSMQQSNFNISLCKKLGVTGFVRKNTYLKDFLQAIEEVQMGKKYFPEFEDEKASEELINNSVERICQQYRLSRSEIKILDKFLEQKKYREIADELCLSPQTVRTHKRNIYRKFGVRNMAGIVGLLKLELERG
ncbi:two component transcriptional regulator, LuxR family [Aquiflexum balticum DSM 16537]|uniref:Two component transcriptional regulator, LuxR family n=2 Tax=Aquiflexum TaxID=280472 RepID=A0A1W2H6W8_9BACT|nr:two component transcriptional regulator, LuxR family [Aquiflexum balticum DSM 16537]